MRFRRKILTLLIIPPSAAILFLFAVHIYATLEEVRSVALEQGSNYVRTVASYVGDLIYYGDYDRVATWLKSIPGHNVEDVLIVSPEGFLIASKRRGLVLFERYPAFEKLRGLKDIRSEEDVFRGVLTFAYPVKVNDQILGYVVSHHSFENLKAIVQKHTLSFAGMIGILLVLTYMVSFYISARISDYISLAISDLESVSKEVFDLPTPPKTGDEFEDLFRGIRIMAKRLKEVHVSRNFYLNLINSLSEGIVVLSRDGRVVEVNSSACRILGCGSEDPKDRHVSEVFPVLYPEIRDLLEGKATKVPETRRVRITRPKGETLDILVSISLYDDLYILLVSDVTQLTRYEEKLRELAERDYLTNVYNRRMFENLLNHEMEKAKRYGRPLSLIMFDIDHFKKVNDTFGHQVGDQVLKKLVDTVRESLRRTDILARWGGEEFMILIPEADVDSAAKLAERLRKIIENTEFGKAGRITVSFGVTQMRKEDTVDTLVMRVDKAVYRAKRKGRNRVEVLT